MKWLIRRAREEVPRAIQENRAVIQAELEHLIAIADYPALAQFLLRNGFHYCFGIYDNVSDAERISLGGQILRSGEKAALKLAIYMISGHIDVNARDKDGNTLLHAAAAHGFRRIASRLIERGSVIDTANNRGDSPLICASRNGHAKIVQLLVPRETRAGRIGADINFTNHQSGMTALIAARESDHQNVARILEKNGANLNTSLMRVLASDNNTNALATLVSAGADANSRNDIGLTPLIVAAVNDRPDLIEILFNHGALIDTPDSRGNTPLVKALQRDALNAALFLIRRNANPNAVNPDGLLPLHIAASRNQTDMQNELIGVGADIEKTNFQGETALISAVVSGHEESVKVLLQHGANPHATNAQQETALMLALMHEHRRIAKILQKKGTYWLLKHNRVDINETLREAARRNHVDAIHALVQGGAKTLPIMDAATEGKIEAAHALIRHGADKNRGLLEAAKSGNVTAMRTFIKCRANVNVTDYKQYTPLMLATARGDLQAVNVLIDEGNADLDAISDQSPGVTQNVVDSFKGNWTALGIAQYRGYAAIAQKLIQAGAIEEFSPEFVLFDRFKPQPEIIKEPNLSTPWD